MRRIAAIIVMLLCGVAGHAAAAEYFIDFADGSDTNVGTSAKQAWQHCPGDANATGAAADAKLQPGDVVRFKGGVSYRGTIVVTASGTAGKPIIFDGNTDGSFGDGRAIIDGSEPLTDLQPCTSAEQADGNPHWQKLLTALLPNDVDAQSANLCQGTTKLRVAQSPDPSSAYTIDYPPGMWRIEKQAEADSFSDPTHLAGRSSRDFADAWFYLLGSPMRMYWLKINAYDPATSTVTFDKWRTDRMYKHTTYSVINALWVLDQPGEYVVRHTPEADGRRRVFVWPVDAKAIDTLTYSTRAQGFDLHAVSDVTFAGFRFQKLTAKPGATRSGAFCKPVRGSGDAGGERLVVRHNEMMLFNGCRGLMLYKLRNSFVEHNHSHDNVLGGGLLLSNFDDSVCRLNRIERIGQTGIDFYRSHRSKMMYNTVLDNLGVHANGLTIYLQSEDILVFGNFVARGNIALTTQRSRNITVANNILTSDRDVYAVADWDGCDGLRYYNNLMMAGSLGLTTGKDSKNIALINNIMSGSGAARSAGPLTSSHNVFTKLSHLQKGPALTDGEIHEPDPRKVFTLTFSEGGKSGYALPDGSPARGAGSVIDGAPEELQKLLGPYGKSPDIGPLPDPALMGLLQPRPAAAPSP